MAKKFIGVYYQGDRETLDYHMDWSPVLNSESDSISSSVWYAEQGSPVIGDGTNGASAPGVTGGVTSCWIIGGAIGDVYHLSNVITTAGGRKFEASLRISVVDK